MGSNVSRTWVCTLVTFN